MDIVELKQRVTEASLPGFLVFTGEEAGLMDMYISQIEKVYGMPFTWLEDVNSALTSRRFCKGISLFCVHGDVAVTKDESCWEKLKTTKGIIVLILHKIKKNERFYKQFSPNVVEFTRMNPQISKQLLRKMCPAVSDSRLEWLLNICGNDYLRAKNELYKVQICGGTEQLFDVFAGKGIFHMDVPDVSFEFKDAVLKRDTKHSFDLLTKLQLNGVEPLMLLGLLYSGFRNLVSFLWTAHPAPNTTGLATGVLYYQRAYKAYTKEQALDALKLIFNVGEKVIKGELGVDNCLEYTLINVLS